MPRRRGPVVRTATRRDAEALHRLSRTFARTGALRERPAALYAEMAGEFLVAEAPNGALEGCVALRHHPAEPGPGTLAVLYNFCVAPASQGRGTGSALLRAVLARAEAEGVRALFTATTGGGELFLRYGFAPGDDHRAPAAWRAALDPGRGSVVLSRGLAD
ncbi:GNAT family N-acetyltransferase [Streptomyces sp. NPDC047097]|uniref:GNAT family N-acetyltransferase n=1 Tax=Streptomyces sp. NPDC047097 TaxID=3155260 RepID=UPI0034033E93